MLFFFCLGIDEISVDAYKGVGHSDSEDTDKSDSSESDSASDEEQNTKGDQDTANDKEPQKEPTKVKVKDKPSENQEESKTDSLPSNEPAGEDSNAVTSDAPTNKKTSSFLKKESQEKPKIAQELPVPKEKSQVQHETNHAVRGEDSDSERELVIDLGEEQGGKERKRRKKESTNNKESVKTEGETYLLYSESGFFLFL